MKNTGNTLKRIYITDEIRCQLIQTTDYMGMFFPDWNYLEGFDVEKMVSIFSNLFCLFESLENTYEIGTTEQKYASIAKFLSDSGATLSKLVNDDDYATAKQLVSAIDNTVDRLKFIICYSLRSDDEDIHPKTR